MTLGAFAAMPMTAQEIEDYTEYVANPGFDEDLTFQIDGTMKEAISRPSIMMFLFIYFTSIICDLAVPRNSGL